MTTKPKTRKASAADPIFALIKEHKAAEKERCRPDEKRYLAQPEAQKKHAPGQTILWHGGAGRPSLNGA